MAGEKSSPGAPSKGNGTDTAYDARSVDETNKTMDPCYLVMVVVVGYAVAPPRINLVARCLATKKCYLSKELDPTHIHRRGAMKRRITDTLLIGSIHALWRYEIPDGFGRAKKHSTLGHMADNKTRWKKSPELRRTTALARRSLLGAALFPLTFSKHNTYETFEFNEDFLERQGHQPG